MADDHRMLRDYALPQATGITSSIVNPTVEVNNFELSPALILFKEWEQFDGHPSENPNAHLHKFLVKCNTNSTGCPMMPLDCDFSISQ